MSYISEISGMLLKGILFGAFVVGASVGVTLAFMGVLKLGDWHEHKKSRRSGR